MQPIVTSYQHKDIVIGKPCDSALASEYLEKILEPLSQYLSIKGLPINRHFYEIYKTKRIQWLNDGRMRFTFKIMKDNFRSNLSQFLELRSFNYRVGPIADSCFGALSDLTQLTCLNFNFDDDNSLSSLRTLTNLISFSATAQKLSPKPRLSDDDFSTLAELPKLAKLSLKYMEVNSIQLKKIGHLTNLTYLSLCGSFKKEGESLEDISHLTNLNHLNLHSTTITNFASIALFTNLKNLSLGPTNFSDEDCCSIIHLTRLKKLDLSFTKLTLKGLEALAPLFNNLTYLYVAFVKATKDELHSFKNDLSKKYKHLEIDYRGHF